MRGNEMKAHLTGKILPFWERLKDEQNGGYIGFVNRALIPEPQAHKGCILNSRILWSFSTAARVLKDEGYLPYARQALSFMDAFEDKENGGLYWSVTYDGKPMDTTKHTYCQAFAVYALAAYVRATGDRAARSKAMALFERIESSCRDEEGYGEAFQRNFSPEDNEKLSENGIMAERTMNTLLHVIEAYAELYRASGDERVRTAGVRALRTVLESIYNMGKARLEVFFDRGYRSLIDMQSYGHDIEASWLLWDAAEAFREEALLDPYRALALNLADAVYRRALTLDGLKNERVGDREDEMRVWWVQAEGVLGFLNAYDLCGEGRFLQAAQDIWAFIQKSIIDPRPGGEWYWSTDKHGNPSARPIVEEWKCPYHNSRMCLRILERGGAERG